MKENGDKHQRLIQQAIAFVMGDAREQPPLLALDTQLRLAEAVGISASDEAKILVEKLLSTLPPDSEVRQWALERCVEILARIDPRRGLELAIAMQARRIVGSQPDLKSLAFDALIRAAPNTKAKFEFLSCGLRSGAFQMVESEVVLADLCSSDKHLARSAMTLALDAFPKVDLTSEDLRYLLASGRRIAPIDQQLAIATIRQFIEGITSPALHDQYIITGSFIIAQRHIHTQSTRETLLLEGAGLARWLGPEEFRSYIVRTGFNPEFDDLDPKDALRATQPMWIRVANKGIEAERETNFDSVRNRARSRLQAIADLPFHPAKLDAESISDPSVESLVLLGLYERGDGTAGDRRLAAQLAVQKARAAQDSAVRFHVLYELLRVSQSDGSISAMQDALAALADELRYSCNPSGRASFSVAAAGTCFGEREKFATILSGWGLDGKSPSIEDPWLRPLMIILYLKKRNFNGVATLIGSPESR